ncbi:MAG TPA: 5,10-methylenetetrahydrofolate reductase, partial [Spirochaetaceae bacterium]|nr:5,10-methylenetetrahydrofolate reductase [Spirochaetaceae bacterium]
SGRCLSIEMVPPPRGGDLESIMAAMEAILPHDPSFVSVTDHPGGKAWADSADGPRRVALRTKPGTLGTAVALRDAFGITTVPHIVGGMADRLDVEDLLIDLHYANFRDIFVVMGDDRYAPASMGGNVGGRGAGTDGYEHASDIVKHIAMLNRGKYTPPAEGKPTDFTIGVAAYPQKHFAAPNPDTDFRHLVEKIRAGAKFVITQMVFEAEPYVDLVRRLRELGLDLPVLPGIKPLFKASSLDMIPRTFFVDIPQPLVKALREARSPEEEKAAGIAWTTKLCGELLDAGAPGLHFFTMGRGAGTRWVLDALYGPKGT